MEKTSDFNNIPSTYVQKENIINVLNSQGHYVLNQGNYYFANENNKHIINDNPENTITSYKTDNDVALHLQELIVEGCADKGSPCTTFILSKCENIDNIGFLNDRKLILKNISFVCSYSFNFGSIGKIDKKAILININACVEFINCTFQDFPGIAVNCTGKSKVSFKGCEFNDNRVCITAENCSILEIQNCRFNDVQEICFMFKGYSVFRVIKSKVHIEDGCIFVLYGKVSGSVEECKFTGVTGKERETSGVESESSNKINFYKCRFTSFSGAVACGSRSKLNLIECEFCKNEQGIGVVERGELYIYSCKFYNSKEVAIFASDDSVISIFDSEIIKNTKHGILIQKSVKMRIYNTEVSNNKGHGIILCDNSEINIRDSHINKNHGAGIYLNEDCCCDISSSSLFNNNLFNIVLFGSSEIICNNNDLYYTKEAVHKDFLLCNVACKDSSKAYFENNKFHAYKDNTGGVMSSDSATVFAKGCTFSAMDYLAFLQGKSDIYIKESNIKNLRKGIAIGEENATLSIVDCNVKAFKEKRS